MGEWLLRGLVARVWEPLGLSSFHEYAERTVLRFEVNPETRALLDVARAEITRNAGHYLSDDEVLQLMARAVLDGAAAGNKHSREGSKDAPKDDGSKARSGDSGRANYQIHLTVCEKCAAGDLRGGGEERRVRPEVVEAAQCDASVIEVPHGTKPDMGPGSSSHVGRASQSIPPAVRRAVVQRDKGRCSVPGCRHHHFVDVHHIKLRSEGGPSDPDNLTLLCSAHHHAVHDGRLIIRGTPAKGLEFLHADGEPYGAPMPPARARPAMAAMGHHRRAFTSLVRLGFGQGEARSALETAASDRMTAGPDPSTEDLMGAALKILTAGIRQCRDQGGGYAADAPGRGHDPSPKSRVGQIQSSSDLRDGLVGRPVEVDDLGLELRPVDPPLPLAGFSLRYVAPRFLSGWVSTKTGQVQIPTIFAHGPTRSRSEGGFSASWAGITLGGGATTPGEPMDQRHADYIEYYRARVTRCQAHAALYPHTLAAEQAMFQAISTAPTMESFGERVHGEGLHVACAVARVRDVETAEATFWQARAEHVRAAPHLEVLKALDDQPPGTVQDLLSMVSSILDGWNLRISADEMLRDEVWHDFKILEDIESDRVAAVPQAWQVERGARAKREVDRGREHFEHTTLPERRKFVPDWQPDWQALSEPRHRRLFPVSDEVLERRVANHREYCGRS